MKQNSKSTLDLLLVNKYPGTNAKSTFVPWCVVTASVSLAKLIPTWFHYLRRLYLSKSIKDSDILILLFFIMIHQSDFFTFQTRSSKPFITWSLQDLDLKFARSRSRSSSTWSLQWHSLWIAASWACTDLQPCCWRKILKFSWTLTRYGWHREQRRNQTFVSKKLLQIWCLHNRMYCSHSSYQCDNFAFEATLTKLVIGDEQLAQPKDLCFPRQSLSPYWSQGVIARKWQNQD